MKASSVNIEKSIRAITCYLVQQVRSVYNYTEDEALCMLMKTMTFELLQDRGSGLYAESSQYVCSMLKNELKGDYEAWLRI